MGKVVTLDLRRATLAIVHGEKLITGQLLPFVPERKDHRGPVLRWDAGSLPPFLDGRSRPVDIGGHLRERFPTVKNIVKRSHNREYAPDELSGQGPSMIPMTEIAPMRTIRRMGRASTPVRFRAEMAKRLTSARIVAGYATKKQAADKLGITLDRYEKWENGRTPVPAQYVGPVCDLFSIDANYLFGVTATVAPKRTG